MPVVWPFPASNVSETLSFLTDVRRTTTGEFRDSLRDATQRVVLSHALEDTDAGHAEAWFRSNASGEWYVPLWHQATFGSAADYGDLTLTVDANADYRAAGKALIVEQDSMTKYELIDVTGVSGTTLTVDGEVSQNYDRPVIMPVLTGFCPNGIGRAAKIGISFLTLEFVINEPTDLAADNLTDYDGHTLFSDEQAIFQSLDGSTMRAVDFIETGFGSMAVEDVETYERFRGSLNVARTSSADRWELVEFLHHARGRERPFWLPTWKFDLEIISAVSAQIEVPIITPDHTDLVGRHIQLDNGGVPVQREITGTSLGASSITLTLSSAPGFLPTRASWLHLVRFDTDNYSLEHRRTSDGYFTVFMGSVVEVAA